MVKLGMVILIYTHITIVFKNTYKCVLCVRFCYIHSCGCVVAEKALKEIKTNKCLVCEKAFEKEDVIVINGKYF